MKLLNFVLIIISVVTALVTVAPFDKVNAASCADYATLFDTADTLHWKHFPDNTTVTTNGNLSYNFHMIADTLDKWADSYSYYEPAYTGDFYVEILVNKPTVTFGPNATSGRVRQVLGIFDVTVDTDTNTQHGILGGTTAYIATDYSKSLNGTERLSVASHLTNVSNIDKYVSTTAYPYYLKIEKIGSSAKVYYRNSEMIDYLLLNEATNFTASMYAVNLYVGPYTNFSNPLDPNSVPGEITGNASYDNFSVRCLAPNYSQSVPVYRFFNKLNGAHLYTVSTNERDTVLTLTSEWEYEGEKFRVMPFEGAGLVAVHRFWNSENGAHLYTISDDEKNTVMNTLPKFKYEGIKFYVYENQTVGTRAVYRFFNTENGAHLYTISEDEKLTIERYLPKFKYEGVKYYVM